MQKRWHTILCITLILNHINKKLMKYFFGFLLLLFTASQCLAQEATNPLQTNRIADSLYKVKRYDIATAYYIKTIDLSDFAMKKYSAAYNAACCLALQNKVDSAFVLLNLAKGFNNYQKSSWLKDEDLKVLHTNKKWPVIIATLKEKNKLNANPQKAKFVTEDIHRFWESYERYLKDTSNALEIFKQNYFNKASEGMSDYMGLKVSSINKFVAHIKLHPKLYSTIKNNTLKIDNFKTKFNQSFKNLKSIYPDAKFPDVYFIIGALTSGGTVSEAGLLIGANQMCKDELTNLDELDFGEKLLINKIEMLPNVVAHELIHFQQDAMVKDTITLGYAIEEGMADFIGELISGKSANPQLNIWVKGKEQKVWNKFKKDMYFDRYNSWIANYDNASDENFPDLGYWIGYEICKAYYENTKDKKRAIYDMLHIKNYRQFLQDSKWEEKVSTIK